ncbi:uncharacterized protein CANTADRAFT_24697 [Suhomyces tanzawaensis NRRL Y-17324]|uniref:CUE domain-containing protein n=1 Tax=Suhomyces tanzawaensis NRRL Y-17324 TaxID=984487 RepID=A0A1E4SR65_9ASCO|nr:uncharacterized protein CANTADRAFT_24697 [Suhomyces tanzawaensis NRRL Y-17324]ODV82000.1 hypothetical protein CANTADRAFT_24697 [Suhomyces tanzawaensis NRRL Y-17324]
MSSVEEEPSPFFPIPHYPPFKLRSSLIDKDPVIWVHLLEAYIKLFQYLLQPATLSVKSQQQHQMFLKVFLSETAEEKSKIFSLGAINPDIKTNTATLRNLVFLYIRNFSLIKSNLTGESVWNFVLIYVQQNSSVVRGLVDGTYKSKFNDNKKSGNISSITSVQKRLEAMITQGIFSNQDLTTLTYLLGQQMSAKAMKVSLDGDVKERNINKKSASSVGFAESFVSVPWIELLERLYAGGKSIHAETIKNIMIISLLSLSVSKLSKLTMELGVKDIRTMKLFPLFSMIIISDRFKELVPNLEERLPFLRQLSQGSQTNEVNQDHVNMLIDLFPSLTLGKATKVLRDHNGDVEGITNMLLENPDFVDSIEEEQLKPKKEPTFTIKGQKTTKTDRKANTPAPKRSVYDDDKISRLDFSESQVIQGKKQNTDVKPSSEDYKKKILTAALELMYEGDEDEPDDTYKDQQKTTGTAIEESSKKGGKSRMAVLEDGAPEPSPFQPDRIDTYLFSILKKNGTEALEKSLRDTPERQAYKEYTGYSDDQIERWLRVLLKSPYQFKVLEKEYYIPTRPSDSKTERPRLAPKAKRGNKPESKSGPSRTKSGETPLKQVAAKNEKNKASRANHNRKTGHNKKTRGDLIGMQGS